MLPLFRRSEDHVDGESEWHGAGKPLRVERITRPHPTSQAFVEAASGLGHPVIDDFNAAAMSGVGYNHITTAGGRRASTCQSFVTPRIGSSRLTVTIDAVVHPVMMLGDGRVFGVEYTVGGTLQQAVAEAEVVLSAGTIGSPKILLLSGIGPADHLSALGIPVAHDLPGVGEKLHDHLLISNVYEASPSMPTGHHNLLESQLYASSGRCEGPEPDIQPVFLHIVYPAESYPMRKEGYTIAAGLVRPQSRGTLRLASNDPDDPPLCDPNVLSETSELEALVDSVDICREIGAGEAFTRWRKDEAAPGEGGTHTR